MIEGKNYKEIKYPNGNFRVYGNGIYFDNRIEPSGLYNYGNSCFMNAFLQCLINCEPLTNYFLTKYKKEYYDCLSNIYLDFIKKYQQKDCYAAKGIINFFLNRDSSIKYTGSDSKDVLIEFFDQIQSELKQAEESVIIENSTNPENEKKVIEERIELDKADYSIIYECFNFWIKNEQRCLNRWCSKFFKNLYEIRSETYFNFYLYEIYNSKNKNSRKKNECNKKLSLDDCFYYYLFETGKCSYCQNKIEIKNKICKLPNILIIVLNRGKNNQYNINVEFNQELNLYNYYQKFKYNINGLNQEVFPKYNLLCGTILVQDYYNPGKGHTLAFATDNNGKYIIYNDKQIINKVGFENIKNNIAYILFYQIKQNNNKTFEVNNTKNYHRNYKNNNFILSLKG